MRSRKSYFKRPQDTKNYEVSSDEGKPPLIYTPQLSTQTAVLSRIALAASNHIARTIFQSAIGHGLWNTIFRNPPHSRVHQGSTTFTLTNT